MISQFFVLSQRGDNIVFRDYRGDIPKGSAEIFFRKVKFWKEDGKEEAPPVFNLDGVNYIHVKVVGLLFVATTRSNLPPSLVLELLQRVARVIKDYLGVLNEESLRKNFVLVYELLDEVIDFGYVQTTSTELLKSYIFNEPIVVDAGRLPSLGPAALFMQGTTRMPGTAITKSVVAHEPGGRKREEIFVDVIEKISVTFSSSGYILTSEIDGTIQMKSVWTRRIRKMEKVEKGGLGSDELFDWRLKMEAAVQDHGVRERVVKKSKEVNAVEALRAYLKEEGEGMGPSFLELVADRLKNDETLKKLLGLGDANQIVPKETILQNVDPDFAVTNDNRALRKDAALSRVLVGKKHARRRSSGTCRGAKISDSVCLEVCPGSKYNLPPTPEVIRIQEALESSRIDLQASVKDPLPNELAFAEEVADTIKGSTDHEPAQENHVNHNPSAVNGAGFVRANGGNPSNGPKPSLMERNSTAHTHEWDDSIENSTEESPDQGSRIKLPSPKRRHVSSLTSNEREQPKKRRRVGKWSADEEDALRTGVEECGEGSWKDILEKYGHRFADRRTQVDLKDKWRNMTRT